jgi:hypothetical protein
MAGMMVSGASPVYAGIYQFIIVAMILVASGITALIVTLLMRPTPSHLLRNCCCLTGSPPKPDPSCTNAQNSNRLLYINGAWLGAISTQSAHNPGKNVTAARRL